MVSAEISFSPSYLHVTRIKSLFIEDRRSSNIVRTRSLRRPFLPNYGNCGYIHFWSWNAAHSFGCGSSFSIFAECRESIPSCHKKYLRKIGVHHGSHSFALGRCEMMTTRLCSSRWEQTRTDNVLSKSLSRATEIERGMQNEPLAIGALWPLRWSLNRTSNSNLYILTEEFKLRQTFESLCTSSSRALKKRTVC